MKASRNEQPNKDVTSKPIRKCGEAKLKHSIFTVKRMIKSIVHTYNELTNVHIYSVTRRQFNHGAERV